MMQILKWTGYPGQEKTGAFAAFPNIWNTSRIGIKTKLRILIATFTGFSYVVQSPGRLHNPSASRWRIANEMYQENTKDFLGKKLTMWNEESYRRTNEGTGGG